MCNAHANVHIFILSFLHTKNTYITSYIHTYVYTYMHAQDQAVTNGAPVDGRAQILTSLTYLCMDNIEAATAAITT